MADANTSLYGLVKPEVGASADSWGGKLNQDYDDIDALLGAITTTGSANAYLLTTGLSLAAYVSGQSFLIKANFTNSGAATINVDGLGAKSLVKGASTALASGDITSGAMYRIAYDGTNFIVLNAGAGSYQPLDATLTALAALSWSSGNSLLQFTAADTVSLTLTPSVTTLTTASTTSTTHGVTAKNTADAATVVALRIEGDRATPANNDSVAASFYLSDSAGNQDEFAQIRVNASDVTSTSEDAELYFRLLVAGSLTTKVVLTGTAFASSTNDATALGTTSLGWADLHLAATGTLNWNNGDVTITHSSNALAFAGASSGYSFDAVVGPSTNDAAALGSATVSWADLFLASGGVINFANGDVTVTHSSNLLSFAGASSGYRVDAVLAPTTNDAAALGTTALGWSDLHLATGAVVNVANGLVTLTHDATNDRLVLAGGALKARPAISTDTGGTLTSASDNCIVDLATAPTINDGVHEAGSIIVLVNNTASSMTITQDTGMTLRLHGTSTTGNLTLAARGIATIQIDPVSNAEAICMGDVS